MKQFFRTSCLLTAFVIKAAQAMNPEGQQAHIPFAAQQEIFSIANQGNARISDPDPSSLMELSYQQGMQRQYSDEQEEYLNFWERSLNKNEPNIFSNVDHMDEHYSEKNQKFYEDDQEPLSLELPYQQGIQRQYSVEQEEYFSPSFDEKECSVLSDVDYTASYINSSPIEGHCSEKNQKFCEDDQEPSVQENIIKKKIKKSSPQHTKNIHRKVTKEQAPKLLEDIKKKSNKEIMESYGIKQTWISNIKHVLSFKFLSEPITEGQKEILKTELAKAKEKIGDLDDKINMLKTREEALDILFRYGAIEKKVEEILAIDQLQASSYFHYVFLQKGIEIEKLLLRKKASHKKGIKNIKEERLEQLKADIGLLSIKDIEAKYDIRERNIRKIAKLYNIKTKKIKEREEVENRNQRIYKLREEDPGLNNQAIADQLVEERYEKLSSQRIGQILKTKNTHLDLK